MAEATRKIKLPFIEKDYSRNRCGDGEQENEEFSSGYFKFEMLIELLSVKCQVDN